MNIELLKTFALRFLLFLILWWILNWLLSKFNWLNIQIGRHGRFWLSIFITILITIWLVLFQKSILPTNVSLKFRQIYTSNAHSETVNIIDDIKRYIPDEPLEPGQTPENIVVSDDVILSQPDGIVGDAAIIRLNAVPKPTRVYILIHPHNTQFWFVQSPMSYNPDNDYWEGVVYFGPQNGDCSVKFDLIAIASRDFWLWDIFRGRGLHIGQKLDFLPVLNQSDMFVVTKVCELIK